MDRNQPFTRYPHESQARAEVPMHVHTNGQLNYVGKGTMFLLSPQAHWVVPWRRLVWIPPEQPHSVRCENLFESWKVMVPRDYARFLPQGICVLKTSPLLLAVLDALPIPGLCPPPEKLAPLAEIIRQELMEAEREDFGVTLPRSERLRQVAEVLLRCPEDARGIDAWAHSVGMSRRTFTRHFIAETGCSFGQWKRSVLLGKALGLLAEGKSVAETADRLGYAYPSAFVAAFRRRYGASPLRFRA